MPTVEPLVLLSAASGLGGPAAVPPADNLDPQPLALQGGGAVAVVGPGDTFEFPPITDFSEADQVPPRCSKGLPLGLTKVGATGVGGTTDQYEDWTGCGKTSILGRETWYEGVSIRKVWSVCVVGRKNRGAIEPFREVKFPAWGLLRTKEPTPTVVVLAWTSVKKSSKGGGTHHRVHTVKWVPVVGLVKVKEVDWGDILGVLPLSGNGDGNEALCNAMETYARRFKAFEINKSKEAMNVALGGKTAGAKAPDEDDDGWETPSEVGTLYAGSTARSERSAGSRAGSAVPSARGGKAPSAAASGKGKGKGKGKGMGKSEAVDMEVDRLEAEVRFLKGDKALAEAKHKGEIDLLKAKLEGMEVALAGKGEQIKTLERQVTTNDGRERLLQKKLDAAEEGRNKAELRANRGTPTKPGRAEEGIEALEIARLRQQNLTLRQVNASLTNILTKLSMCTAMLSGDGTGVPAAPTLHAAKLACDTVAEAHKVMLEADTMSKDTMSDSQ